MVHNGHVGIPLDIVYLGVFGHKIVDNTEYKVLYLGVAQIEYYLRASTSQDGIAFRSLYNPFWMGFVEF